MYRLNKLYTDDCGWEAGSLDLNPANNVTYFIPIMQDQAAHLMDDILTLIPIESKLNS